MFCVSSTKEYLWVRFVWNKWVSIIFSYFLNSSDCEKNKRDEFSFILSVVSARFLTLHSERTYVHITCISERISVCICLCECVFLRCQSVRTSACVHEWMDGWLVVWLLGIRCFNIVVSVFRQCVYEDIFSLCMRTKESLLSV